MTTRQNVPDEMTSRRRTGVLFAMCLALVLVVGSVSGVNLVLPHVAVAIGASATQLTWIADAYTVALAALVLPMGALGDRLGRRNVLLAGAVVFGTGSMVGAAASSASVLIVARAVMGVGAAMIMPGTLSTITGVFRSEERGRAAGIWSGFAVSGSILGMLLSGALLERFSWVSTFVASAALAGVAFGAAALLAPNTADPHPARLDTVGSVLSGVGIGGLVFGIIEGAERGWLNPLSVGGFTVAAVGLVGWTMWSLRVGHPLLDPRLFRLRGFATGSAAIAVQFLVSLGFFLVGLQFLLLVLGYSALMSTVALLPIAAVAMPVSVVAPALAARVGVRPVIASGMATIAVGFVLLAQLRVDSTYWSFLIGLGVFGVGVSLASTPATTAIVSPLPRAKQGVASAVNDVSRELGAAIGIATLGSLFNRSYANAIKTTAGLPASVAGIVRRSPAAGLDITGHMAVNGAALAHSVKSAFIHGLGAALIGGAIISFVGAAFVLWRGPRRSGAGGEDVDANTPASFADARSGSPTTEPVSAIEGTAA